MKKPKWLSLIAAIAICELAGVVGSFFTTPAINTWYRTLVKPDLAPPNWIFAPVWTTLFFLMGIAVYLVWEKNWNRKEKKLALMVFFGQLILNIIWSILFFGLRNPALAFIEIILLWLAIAASIYFFSKISKPAAWLLIPYILWVSFASYLNFQLWQLNQDSNAGAVACTEEAKLCPDGSYVGRTGPNCEFTPCP